MKLLWSQKATMKDGERQRGSGATWCARSGKEREVQSPRLALEINSSNLQQPALGKSD